jgi:hypothetical protein
LPIKEEKLTLNKQSKRWLIPILKHNSEYFMKLTEILTESEQQRIDELDVGKAARAVGKGIGAVGKGLGAVAGVPQGIGRAIKKGYKGAVSTIGGDDSTAPSTGTGTAPAAQGGSAMGAFTAGLKGKTPTAQQINKAGPKGTAPAKAQTGAAAQAMQKTAQATSNQNAAQAGQTVYAQVKANIDKLDKKGKQRIMQLLQKSLAQTPAAAATPTAKQPAASAPTPTGKAVRQMAAPTLKQSGHSTKDSLAESYQSIFVKK